VGYIVVGTLLATMAGNLQEVLLHTAFSVVIRF
jgi:hypothetical protein